MATIHLERIRNALHKQFGEIIDLSDLRGRPDPQVSQSRLSRAVSAYAVLLLADTTPIDAARAVTDGFDDGGIDAIFFDRPQKNLLVVQGKWCQDGRSAFDQGECLKFINGFRSLINLELDGFNARIKAKAPELSEALRSNDARITIVLAYPGTEALPSHVDRDLQQMLAEQNDPVELIHLEVLDQLRLYEGATGARARPRIRAQLLLREWGAVREPFVAYYGQIDAPTIAKLLKEHGSQLFARNIRHFRGSTEVNQAVETTLRRQPEQFWYLNNGITVICDSVQKLPVGGSSRGSAVFDCHGLSVVNGAQTIGVLARVSNLNGLENVPVFVRLISLEGAPSGFDKLVARATNTQNRIGSREFAALDPNQQRLSHELLLDGFVYAYKGGDEDPPPSKGCSIVDATVALACAHDDINLAVQAKREIGRLWENIDGEPYILLFNDRTSATMLWRAVRILRTVDNQLSSLKGRSAPRAELAAVHGNRMVLHRVFQDPRIRQFANAAPDAFDVILRLVPEVTTDAFTRLLCHLDQAHKGAYLAALFKNHSKCRSVDDHLAGAVKVKSTDGRRALDPMVSPSEPFQTDLFSDNAAPEPEDSGEPPRREK